ncbi:hypothetical protein [Campylobacter concisus]|uniref:hypothetical protein n=1 Tax=Campylobacter concisus TaxID=199 RepID=UPI000CD96AF0|nr:hypothetical protein [Campylobacter concisus]
MKKVSLLALSGIVALSLLGCDGGGVAHSLKEVCENPKKQYESLEANVYYKIIEFPIGPGENSPKGDYVKFFDENGNEQYYILQNPSDIMGYNIRYSKKEGEIFKLKGENPKCYGKSVHVGLIREE